jgi:hypothetical protein
VKKILLVLQCYEGDKRVAMQLARLIADLECDGKSRHADFMFAWRWDTAPDMQTIQHVARKFDAVHTFTSGRKTKGWPQGCNDLFFEAYGRFCIRVKQKFWDYDAALFFESDCVPLARDWIEQLQREWYERDQSILGFIYGPGDHPIPHVNGNLMISPRFQRECREFFACPSHAGWDCAHAKAMLKHARASRLIFNDYSRKSIGREELFAPKSYGARHPLANQTVQPVFYHGVKGTDAIDCVRKEFCLG